MPVIYSARWVLPIISESIESGAVAISGSQILDVGSKSEIVARFPDAEVTDFGEAAILPGFVNTHSHLELTVMRGFLEAQEHDFFAWLRKLTGARMAMSAADLQISAVNGAIEAARAGITCLGDSSSLAAEVIKALAEVGLRGTVYQESFGPDPGLAAGNLAKLHEQLAEAQRSSTDLVRTGVSPHAPYTVSAPQLEMISRLALQDDLPLMMHVAESNSEELLLKHGAGAFAEGLRQRGIEWRAPGLSSVKYLERHGVLETNPLFVHCVHVDDDDLQLIKTKGAGVAHCPKSNAKLRHGRAPFSRLLAHGIDCGLGSDSVASNNTCDILEEARFAILMARLDAAPPESEKEQSGLLGAAQTNLSAKHILFAATAGGARALKLSDQIGTLAAGMQADITVVRLGGAHQLPVFDPADALIFSSSGRDVVMTMVAGREIYRNGLVETVDERAMRSELEQIKTKLGAAS